MVLRVLGLKEEESYGNLKSGTVNPDFHRRLSDGEFKLNDEPVTSNDGSRMVQMTRAGAVKPTGSTGGKCDLKRIGHYLKAFFDQYNYTDGGTSSLNTHEFWGREGQDLTSFHGWATFDYFQKVISGLLLDTFKLEVSNEYMEQTEEWVYKTETWESINQSTYTIREVEGEIPLMFYDVNLKLNDTTMNDVVFTSFSFEGKNNLNQDGTIGLGSRFPQRKATAQAREINISVASYLSNNSNFLNLLKGSEYGETTATSPSSCKIFKIPVEVGISTCENTDESLKIYLPKCTVAVEYSASESDEIEVTFNLVALGTGTLANFDQFSENDPLDGAFTDCYCKLVNDMEEIEP